MRVKNFSGFMKSKQGLNESDMGGDHMGYMPHDDYGANPEAEDMPEGEDADMPEGEDEGAEEEVTLEDLKAMVDDLTERVKALEGDEEEEEGEATEGEEGEAAEGEEGEAAEGEEEEAGK